MADGRSRARSGTTADDLIARATLEWKCRGLSDEQLRVALQPSSMTLGGLLKHLACLEDSWFTEVVAGEPAPEPWASVDFQADPEWNWHSAAR